MGFDGALRDIQVLCYLCVVAPLQKKIDNLLLPVSRPIDLLLHVLHLTGCAEDAARARGSSWSPLRT